MSSRHFSRRHFLGGASAAAALGSIGLTPEVAEASLRRASERGIRRLPGGAPMHREWQSQVDAYDALAKLSSNENPFGPSDKAIEAMTYAFKYSMRYGYPDNNVQQRIADAHGVRRDHVLMGAGSGEILDVVGLTYLAHDKKVVGVEPSYGSVYSHATGIDAETILLPLESDYRQNIQRMVDVTNRNARDVGFVYLCNPNNPTGVTVTAEEVAYLLDNIPEDIPVLIDEAYHRRGPGVRRVAEVRARRTSGGGRAHLLQDLRHGRHADRLRDRPAGHDRRDAPLQHRERERPRSMGCCRLDGRRASGPAHASAQPALA